MMRVCAWCKTVLGVVSSKELSDVSVTHGICEKCMNGVVLGYSEMAKDNNVFGKGGAKFSVLYF